MSKAVELLNLIIEAGNAPVLPLHMRTWYDCGTSCCLCGDVAIYQNSLNIAEAALDFAELLDLHLGDGLAESIYSSTDYLRKDGLQYDLVREYPDNLLNHPHVNTDHNDRAIAHDYIREVIKFLENEQ